jgi:hypothetical protein
MIEKLYKPIEVEVPLTMMIKIACQNGGISFGGSMNIGLRRSSFMYHQ